MQQDSIFREFNHRWTLAAAILTTVLLVAAWAGSDYLRRFMHSGPMTQPSGHRQIGDGPLFYKSVGHAPEDFRSPRQSDTAGRLAKPHYTVEIRIANSQGEADEMLNKLEAQGIQAFYTPLSNNGHVIYRVRTGVFADRRLAVELSKSLSKTKKISNKVGILR